MGSRPGRISLHAGTILQFLAVKGWIGRSLLIFSAVLILSGCALAWSLPGGALTALVASLLALFVMGCDLLGGGGGGGGKGGTVTIANGHAKEGDSSMTFTVSRSGGSGKLSVAYSTADGTAVAGSDYASESGTVTPLYAAAT